MAKQEVRGFTGSMTTPTGTKFDVVGYAVGLHMDDIVIPAAFGSRWKKHDLGAGELTGSLHGTPTFDAASTNPMNLGTTDWANFKASCVLTFATNCTITCTIAVRDVELTYENGQVAAISANFSNADEPVVAWDESA